MTTSTITAESEAYLAAVKEQLSDLPEEERTDLLEDLAQHLADITADRPKDGPPLTALLGEPEKYAAELRAAADLPPRTAPTVTKESFIARLGRSGPVRLSQNIWRKPVVLQIREFVPQLRPAWWVLRGYLLIAVPALARVNSTDDFPVPAVGGSNLLGLLFVAGAIVASVWLGKHPGPAWRRRLIVAGNAVLIMLSVGLLSEVDYRMTGGPQFVSTYSGPQYQLSSPHGPVTNIFPYAADGTPLKGVLLYDQDGRPLRSEMQQWWADHCARAVAFPRAADGVGVEFSYPKEYVLTGQNSGVPCKAEGYAPQVPLPTFPASPGPAVTIEPTDQPSQQLPDSCPPNCPGPEAVPSPSTLPEAGAGQAQPPSP